MKAIEKVELIRNIATTLYDKLEFTDVKIFLDEFETAFLDPDDYNNIHDYAKDRLSKANKKEIKKIADELEISTDNLIKEPPKNWEDITSAKVFISHTSENKGNAKRLRNVLKVYNIESFVAHEDIKPSEEWQKEIEKALKTMDFFISIHTKGFSNSIWCQQEVGFAVSQNVKIIPIKFEENPEGFISKIQALIRGQKTAEDIAKNIVDILKDDNKTKDLYSEKIEQAVLIDDEIPF